ncbi:hypothetical protein VTN77DRAFT_5184 [Rasamsonia byssochlamydoides]|uniref:uncharacterized protein n=1 Tax=Rasamsonia byssochlamydoides TaxID=89139 RepID=UPI003742A7A0
MSRQPRLDTSHVPQQRYSYVETPIEMSLPGSQSRGPGAQLPSVADADTKVNANINPPPPAETPQPASNLASEKRELEQARQMRLQEEQAISPGNKGPLVHPALFAPYADDIEEQSQRPAPQTSPQSPCRSPPHSPGPLPIKHPRPPPIQPGLIAPDANPLQTPRSPPAAKGAFRPIVARDATGSDEAHPNHLPGQISHPEQEIKGGTWSTSFGECSDIGTCCLGIWCPCILYGRTQYRLSRKSRREDPTNLLGFEACNGSCTAMALLCGCQCILAAIQHTRTRKTYEIEGDICTDYVRASCCICCTLIQDDREIRKREEARAYSAQVSGTALIAPYIPPGPMQYPPPPK